MAPISNVHLFLTIMVHPAKLGGWPSHAGWQISGRASTTSFPHKIILKTHES